MVAQSCQATFSFKWTDGDGDALTVKGKTLVFPGTLLLRGSLSIPAGLSSGTEVDLLLPGLVQGVSFMYLENMSGQELNMAWGGNFYPHLPDQGVMLYMFPVAPAAGAVTGWRFFLTQG